MNDQSPIQPQTLTARIEEWKAKSKGHYSKTKILVDLIRDYPWTLQDEHGNQHDHYSWRCYWRKKEAHIPGHSASIQRHTSSLSFRRRDLRHTTTTSFEQRRRERMPGFIIQNIYYHNGRLHHVWRCSSTENTSREITDTPDAAGRGFETAEGSTADLYVDLQHACQLNIPSSLMS